MSKDTLTQVKNMAVVLMEQSRTQAIQAEEDDVAGAAGQKIH